MMTDTSEEVALGFGDGTDSQRRNIRHPAAVAFHLLFRISALLMYILGVWVFSTSFIVSFVIIVVLISMDFWTVKNITGRLLVGLRWWNYVDEEGKSHWVYEARKGEERNLVNASESRIFWLSLVLTEVVWGLILFGTLFRLNIPWMMVVIIALVLNGANLYGYVRCKVGTREKFSTAAKNFFTQQMLRGFFSRSNATENGQPPV